MDDYDNDANDLKQAFDDTMKIDYDMSLDRFINLMISVCADGTSENMGIYNGACTQIKTGRMEWMLVIHCTNHRLELPIGGAYKVETNLRMLTLSYLMFTNFSKQWKIEEPFNGYGLNIDVTCVSFVKSHGMRFQNHNYRAIKAVLINLVPLYLLCENMIAG